jgi:hypothetical protein
LPIAIDEASRRPIEETGLSQSFDLPERLDGRPPSLGIRWGAERFLRESLSRVLPTCHKSGIRLFLSYRRQDGEGAARFVDQRLSRCHEQTFRDLVSIQTGEVAQERIEQELAKADVVVFVDTPQAGTSEWVARELEMALGRNIPIVWVRLGMAQGRPALRVEPSSQPDIVLEKIQSEEEADPVAQRVLELAFLASQNQVTEALSTFRRIQEWASRNHAGIQVVDARRMIYRVEFQAVNELYPRRPRVHVLQVFGRRITDEDLRELESSSAVLQVPECPEPCRPYDALLVLEPTPTPRRAMGVTLVEHGRRYLEYLERQAMERAASGARLILLGSFPSESSVHQSVADAVYGISTEWLLLGGSLVMGGHPTFTPLVVEASHVALPEGSSDRLTIVWSRWFVSEAQAALFSSVANVVLTPSRDTLVESLSDLRREMITRRRGDAVLLVGGRTTEGGEHIPGTEEELSIAREEGLPAFLVGAPGGQAALIAERERVLPAPFSGLGNSLTVDENEELFWTNDFRRAARLVFEGLRR